MANSVDVTNDIYSNKYTILSMTTNTSVVATFDNTSGDNPSVDGHEYVDLGLPSGKLWANANYGADKPEDLGNYSSSTYFSSWGSNWRMPTKEEYQELLDECEWTWSDLNGVNGFRIKGPNGQSLFLPAAGKSSSISIEGTSQVGSNAYYMTSSKGSLSIDTWIFSGSASGHKLVSTYVSMEKYSVRPICKKKSAPAITEAPTAISGLAYTGIAQVLVTKGTAKGGEMQYSLDNNSFSAAIPTATDAGKYKVYFKVVSVEDNNSSEVQFIETIIKQAPLTISGGMYTMKQGEALPTFTATYAGFKNNETESVLTKKPTLTTTATSASEPGTYDVVVAGAEATNYDISYVKGTLTITAADKVTVTAKDYTIKYGDAIPTFEYSSTGAALSGTPAISCAATSVSPVGTYPITIAKGSVTNYNVDYVNGTLTIEKAPLTISGGSYEMKQGEALPTFTATYAGFKNNETESVLTKKPTLTITATSASEPGTYDVVVAGAEAQNYDISYVKGTLTITAASGIGEVSAEKSAKQYYTLDGRKLQGQPMKKGVYVVNGRKVVKK